MRWLRRMARGDMSLRRRLLLSIGVGMLPALMVALILTLVMNAVSGDFRQAQQRGRAAAQIADLQARITETGTAMTSALSAGGTQTLDRYLAENRSMPAMFRSLAANVPKEAQAYVAAAAQGWEKVWTGLTQLRTAIQEQGSGGARVLPLLIAIGDNVVPPEHALEAASKAAAESLTANLGHSQDRQDSERWALLVLTALGFGLALFLSQRVFRSISEPIDRLRAAAEQLDPDEPTFVEVPGTPELAALTSSFNAMADRLATSSRVIAQNEARLQALFRNASELVMIVKPDLTVVTVTPPAQLVLGMPPEALIGSNVRDLLHPADLDIVLAAVNRSQAAPQRFEFVLRRPDGEQLTADVHVVDLTDEPAVRGIVLTVRDVSERKELEQLLTHQAFHDTLTGLPNRALLRDRLAHALKRRPLDRPIALLFVDLNDFKTVNDSLGHSAGDELLQVVAGRLELQLREGDTAARLGGDEFVILLEGAGEDEALAAAQRLVAALAEPATVSGIDVFPHASIGIAVGKAGDTADQLLAHADAAMYTAKGNENGAVRVYNEDLSPRLLQRLELKADLERAVERGEIHVHYQPILDLSTGRTVGVEALARWEHPTRGRIMPLDFIPLAEQTGLIVSVGQEVLNHACHQLARWQREFGSTAPDFLTVNVSARQLREPGLAAHVEAAVTTSGIRPEQLTLEITESVMLSDDESALRSLDALKSLGVRLAVDDFGTGYSSLAYLQRLPLDVIKLDKSFVGGLVSGEHNAAAVAMVIVELGHELGLQIIAEGIESEQQAALLSADRCDYGQGYYFHRPMPADQLSSQLGWVPSTSRAGAGAG